ncbi:MAG TPA: hypothetical protein VFV70_13810 [Hyphomonadaceae bacterium]|nr:hypothetical protein [Hyphomonadaceae bacterium]
MAERYRHWGLVGVILVLSTVFAVAGIRRRVERGRPARFHFGFGAGFIDVIEGLTGKELSPRAQAIVFAITGAIGVLALAAGLALLARRGTLS